MKFETKYLYTGLYPKEWWATRSVNRAKCYYGLVYTKTFGAVAYIVESCVQLMRNLGAIPSLQNSLLLNVGMETLAVRMERHYQNAQAVVEYLEKHDLVVKVTPPGLTSSPWLWVKTKILTERFMWHDFFWN